MSFADVDETVAGHNRHKTEYRSWMMEINVNISAVLFLVIALASIAGGLVLYRGSRRVGWRALGMSAVALGAGVLLVVALTLPVSTEGEAPEPVIGQVPIPAQSTQPPTTQQEPSGSDSTGMTVLRPNRVDDLPAPNLTHGSPLAPVSSGSPLHGSPPPPVSGGSPLAPVPSAAPLHGSPEPPVSSGSPLAPAPSGAPLHGDPGPSLKFGDVNYVYSGSAELPSGVGAYFVIDGIEFTMDYLERVGTTNEGNTAGIQEGLVVYRLKGDGPNEVYTFNPGEDHVNPEDGQIFKGQDVWTRWTTR